MPETWSTSINQDSRLANHVKRHWSNGWCTHLLRKRPRFDSRRRQKQYTDVFSPSRYKVVGERNGARRVS